MIKKEKIYKNKTSQKLLYDSLDELQKIMIFNFLNIMTIFYATILEKYIPSRSYNIFYLTEDDETTTEN